MADAVRGPGMGPGRLTLWFDTRGRAVRLALVAALGAVGALGLAPFGWPVATVAALMVLLPLAGRAGLPRGTLAGQSAGVRAGERTGVRAGVRAGEPAGELAGARAGAQAGEPAGEPAGVRSGERSGERTGVRAGVRGAFGIGWAFGAGYFALALHWIIQPFLVDVGRHGWMAPFALLLLAGGLALFWGAALALAAWLAPGGGRARLAALVICWTGAEALRALILTGFPWAMPGHVWIGTPLAQMSAMVGPFGLTLFTLAVASLPGAIGARIGLVVPWLAVGGLWLVLDPGPAPAPLIAAPIVRLVQPDVPQNQKWDPDLMRGHFDRLLRLTSEGGPADLVVWPETALPYLLEDSTDLLAAGAAAAGGAPLVLGIQRREGASRYYNSLILAGPGGQVQAIYDKAHLVPFGEYMPLGDVMARLGIHGLAASEGRGFSAGPGPQVIDIPGIGPALVLICYEGIFAEEVNATPMRPRLIVLITNDAWFGHFAGPYQHADQARLRAIEQGVPLVRVANTGVSALYDARGRVLGQIGMDRAGALDLALPPALAPTPYARWGDWPVLVLLILALGALAVRRATQSG